MFHVRKSVHAICAVLIYYRPMVEFGFPITGSRQNLQEHLTRILTVRKVAAFFSYAHLGLPLIDNAYQKIPMSFWLERVSSVRLVLISSLRGCYSDPVV